MAAEYICHPALATVLLGFDSFLNVYLRIQYALFTYGSVYSCYCFLSSGFTLFSHLTAILCIHFLPSLPSLDDLPPNSICRIETCLHAPTSSATRFNEASLTYLNQGQTYELVMQWNVVPVAPTK
ncbi:unnamed protein product, partial [Dicrocoelium dendriticum]